VWRKEEEIYISSEGTFNEENRFETERPTDNVFTVLSKVVHT
jgi:hypothetical protein